MLPTRQDIDGVMARLAEGFQIVRLVIQAPQHQRGLQRHGRKGVHRQPDGMTIRVNGRNDGNTGGKAAKGIAQGARIGLG